MSLPRSLARPGLLVCFICSVLDSSLSTVFTYGMILQMNKTRHRTLMSILYVRNECLSFSNTQFPYNSHARSHVHLNGKYGTLMTFPRLCLCLRVLACWKEIRSWILGGISTIGINLFNNVDRDARANNTHPRCLLFMMGRRRGVLNGRQALGCVHGKHAVAKLRIDGILQCCLLPYCCMRA
jgi:hypothetical protein